ncbi:AzlC family ABC transporter permease [Thioclava sp. GXIMD4216]|uniref:AzlC family ABC transporter permease n=1 Tax=Thioclava litoralis TaxID=3076557 RepID=A0ABZ1DXE9_9RHOB|nr:AzlC family ABC transporter permease [Thioclava sp. FTW29]
MHARHAFLRGIVATLPFTLVIAPFGLLFGVAATEAGLDLGEVMGFTILVIAGASQFSAIHLMEEHAPVILVILTSLAINLRMAMYSAALAPHLGQAKRWQHALVAYFMVDQTFVTAETEYRLRPEMSLPAKLAFYAGCSTVLPPLWYLSTLLGAVAGAAIPPEFALDFALPITFLAMIAPALRSLPHIAATLMSVCAALLLAFLPAGMGLLIAAVCAMVTGAQVELFLARRRAA